MCRGISINSGCGGGGGGESGCGRIILIRIIVSYSSNSRIINGRSGNCCCCNGGRCSCRSRINTHHCFRGRIRIIIIGGCHLIRIRRSRNTNRNTN